MWAAAAALQGPAGPREQSASRVVPGAVPTKPQAACLSACPAQPHPARLTDCPPDCRGEVWTPSTRHQLQGITRAHVLELCADNGIVAREADFYLTQAGVLRGGNGLYMKIDDICMPRNGRLPGAGGCAVACFACITPPRRDARTHVCMYACIMSHVSCVLDWDIRPGAAVCRGPRERQLSAAWPAGR